MDLSGTSILINSYTPRYYLYSWMTFTHSFSGCMELYTFIHWIYFGFSDTVMILYIYIYLYTFIHSFNEDLY